MGSRVSPNPNCWRLRTPCSLCHSWKTTTQRAVPSLPLKNVTMPCRLVYGFTFSGLMNLRVHRVKHACSNNPFDDFHHELANDNDDDDHDSKEIAFAVSDNTQNREFKGVDSHSGCSSGSGKFCTMKPDLLEPSLLGIKPEPPIWPEREEILRLSFERRVNGVGIPFSIRMIKKKLQLQKSFNEASDLTHSSVKKAFSSMLFIFHQLQNHALQTRESMFLDDFDGVMEKLRVDMDASFVWLFQQVFWKTPTFMVYVMVLLADFSVFSMSNNTATASTISLSMVTNITPLKEHKSEEQHSQEVGAEVDQDLTEAEQLLWDSMVEEASMLQEGLKEGNEVLDHEIRQRFVAPVSVELEGDRYEEYFKTEFYYQKHLRRSPQNSLLLSNYAHFLYLVAHDHDRAEEYYRRSVLAESPEAEAFSRYADFLWLVRKDIWAAELRYLQALEAEPGNTYYVSKYASFLWNTGGQDSSTSFPLEEFDNLQL